MISRRGYTDIRDAMAGMARDDLTQDAATLRPMPAVVDAHGSPVALRSRHPELAGCPWCNDYCYDHLIEWVLQGRPFLAAWEPRVTQVPGEGMTSQRNDINAVYDGRPLAQGEFEIRSAAVCFLRLFSSPGLSAIAPPLTAIQRAWTARVAAGEADVSDAITVEATAAFVPRSEVVLMWVTEPLIIVAVVAALGVLIVAALLVVGGRGSHARGSRHPWGKDDDGALWRRAGGGDARSVSAVAVADGTSLGGVQLQGGNAGAGWRSARVPRSRSVSVGGGLLSWLPWARSKDGKVA